jgi:hypothetical protein
MHDPVELFVIRENLRGLRKQLENEIDEARRKQMLRLLAEEEAKLQSWPDKTKKRDSV